MVMYHDNSKWSEKSMRRLVVLVREGKSAGQISAMSLAEFGAQFTRNAICGKVARLREHLDDDTLRVGLSVKRIGTARQGGRPKMSRSEAASVAAQARWNQSHSTAVMNSLRALAKSTRKAERRLAMLNLSDYPNAVHILDRVEYTHFAGAAMGVAIIQHAQCPWPIWNDDDSFSERFMCGNPKEEHGRYCAAHMCMAHDVRLPGQFNRKPGFINKWTATLTVLRGRAA